MKLSDLAQFMNVSGTITGRAPIHWLKVPNQKNGSFASMLGLQSIGHRSLRISSTVGRDGSRPNRVELKDASIRHGG